MSTGAGCRIRRATPDSVTAIAALERAAFSDPWSEPLIRRTLGPHALVAERVGAVVGYVLARVVVDEAEVLSIGVDPRYRREGIGRALLSDLLVRFERASVRVVALDVRPSNVAARALYAEFGFREVGRRRRYYRDPAEDGLVLRRDLDPLRGSA